MNNGFDDELEHGRSRRSRRQPSAGSRAEDTAYGKPYGAGGYYDDDYDDDYYNGDSDDAIEGSRYQNQSNSRPKSADRRSANGSSSKSSSFSGSSPRSSGSDGRSKGLSGGVLTSMNEPESTGPYRVSSGAGGSRSRTRTSSTDRRNTGTRQTAASSGSSSPVRKARDAASKRRRRIITVIVAECLALVFIFSYAFVAKRWNMIQRPKFELGDVKNNELDINTVEKMKGYWTIAVFGVDSRGSNVGKGTNADVNMICNINQDTGEIKLVSVFRDTYLNISDDNRYNKLNQAYAVGGPQQAVKALNKNLDLNITDYVTFNWKAVADAINILGGVDMEISKAEFRQINGFITETVEATGIASFPLKKAGLNHLDGVQAVAYGRLRLMDTDFARTERQRKVIQAAFDKAKKADISVLNNIMVTVFPQVATSVGFDDLADVAFSVSKYHIGETGGFPSARSDANMGKKGACVIPKTLESNVVLLHQFLFGDEKYEPTSSLKKISSKISDDSGQYTAGNPVGHVRTDGGYIPEETKEKEKTTEKTKEETSEVSQSRKDEEETSDGTLSSGGDRPGGDASGWEQWETDEYGDPIDPAWGNNQGTTGSSQTTGPTKPGTTTSPSKPGATTSPTKPGTTTGAGGSMGPGSTTAASTEQGTSSTVTTIPTAPVSPGGNTGSSTTAPGSGGSSGGPGVSNENGVIVGPPGS